MKLGLARRGYSPTGGAEAYLKRFAVAATAAGHECVLFTTADWPAKEWPYERRTVKHGGSPLEFALALAELRPRQSCDFLVSLERVTECDAYRAGDGVHAAWLERRAKFEPAWKNWWRARRDKHHEILRLEEMMFRGESARIVIANSHLVQREIVERYGYPADRIFVVHNGVPPAFAPEAAAELRAKVRAELGIDEHTFVLLFGGSDWGRKGLRFAIEAVNEAAVGGPVLLVAGNGRRWRMPRSSRVRYVGATPGLGPWLAAADVFILPTIYDPFSNACLEALAAGLPVISTVGNGFSEIIDDGVEGDVLQNPGDVAGLARAIENWAPPGRRAAIRERLREKGARFSIDENVRATMGVFARSESQRKRIPP
jgi:UDP-glucose:(heptosyl)LPS alpha-1,3-glucosyltransferase